MSNADLADFISAVSKDDRLAIEENLGGGYVRLRTAEAERRQAKHDIRCVEDIVIELLRNSRDAHASAIYVAIAREKDMKTICVIDDGDGIVEGMHERVFEPRVTSKLESVHMDKWGVHGRGMALYSIKSNALFARVACSGEGLGCALEVGIDLESLPEKTDQSSLPVVSRGEDGKLFVERGPHNVNRCAVEFALESKDRVSVYLGSPADIAARLLSDGKRKLTDEQKLFCDSFEELPVCIRLAACVDSLELTRACESIGLGISERTAHRILSGQIEPCGAILDKVAKLKAPAAYRQADLYRDERGLRISQEDMERFCTRLEKAFEPIAEQYYLGLDAKPHVRVGKDAITVRFPITKEL